jgi:polysaccharide pyruvyl transferase WcaK-like protein
MKRHALKVDFTGYYGMNNFGDDLFGAICSAAARHYWSAEPRLVGPAIPGVASRYTMPHWYPARAYGATGALGKASRFYSFLRATEGPDVLVMGGGSVITARESFRKPMMLSAQRRRGLQLAAVGVSIGPFPDAASEDSAAAFLEHFSYVAVRDRRSYELAERMGLAGRTHNGRDLAGLLPLLLPEPEREDRARAAERPLRIGLAPCNYKAGSGYPAPDPATWQAGLVEALHRLARQRRLQVDVFSVNEHPSHGDYALAQTLCQALRERGIGAETLRYRQRSPLSIVEAIDACDAVFSARLHGAIVAYLRGVPFTIIDYHPKCRDFAEDIGLADHHRISADRQTPEAFSAALESMLGGTGEPTLSRQIYAHQAQDVFKCAPWATTGTAQ